MTKDELMIRRTAPLLTPTSLPAGAVEDLQAALNVILADVFTLYMKTKNFHKPGHRRPAR